MSYPTDNGTPLRRTRDGDLVPDPDHPDLVAERRRDAIARCREAITRAKENSR